MNSNTDSDDFQRGHSRRTSDSEDAWGYTENKVIQFSYTWTISNFSYSRVQLGEEVKSPVFSGTGCDDSWCLVIKKNSNVFFGCYLQLESCSKREEVPAKFQIFIKDGRNKVFHRVDDTAKRELKGFTEGTRYGTIIRQRLQDYSEELLLDDKLTFYCEVDTVTDVITTSPSQFRVPECKLSEDIAALLETQTGTDVVLTLRDKEYPAHKTILIARSPYFSALFEHEKKDYVEMMDMDDNILRELLHFIYHGRVEDTNNLGESLLAAADYYCLERLKAMCEKNIYFNLSIFTAAEVLIFSDKYSAEQLKTHVINFVNLHTKEVLNTQGWKSMMKTHGYLEAEVFRYRQPIFESTPKNSSQVIALL